MITTTGSRKVPQEAEVEQRRVHKAQQQVLRDGQYRWRYTHTYVTESIRVHSNVGEK